MCVTVIGCDDITLRLGSGGSGVFLTLHAAHGAHAAAADVLLLLMALARVLLCAAGGGGGG